MNVQNLKGFRDFLPKEAKKRQYVIDKIRGVFESYGFEPLETPALEYKEILTGKYGEEEKLIYDFKTRGGDEVALRYDQTVPLARVVAQYQSELPIPFKRYQIQNVWRGENTQKGRYREFLQCDADIVGTPSLLADAEIVAVAIDSMKQLRFNDAQIWINDREIFDQYNLTKQELIALDKLDKIGEQAVIKIWKENGRNNAEELFKGIRNIEPTERVKKLFTCLENMGYQENKDFAFVPYLVRGLDYYNSIIFELKLANSTYMSSLGGGGRYDKLIGMFAGKDIPAVGFAFGFDRLIEAMEELNLFPADLEVTKVLVTENDNKALEIASKLRNAGINAEIWLGQDSDLGKKIKYAKKKQIPYVVKFKDEGIILGNMKTGEQKTLKLEELEKELG